MPRDYYRNHIASASYLSGFADARGELCAVAVTDGTVSQARPHTMGYRPAFWGKDRQVRTYAEQWLSALESDFPSAVSRLTDAGVPAPGTDHRLALMLLMAIHAIRNPAVRDNIVAIQQCSIAQHADKYRAGITEAQYQDLLARFTSDAFVAQLMLGHVSKLASFLGSMHWTLVEFDAALLATSDQPMVLLPSRGASALGDTFEARFAVTPRYALILAWVDVPDATRVVAGGDVLAAHLNRAVVAQADAQWFHHPERRPVRSIAADLGDTSIESVAEQIHDGYDVDQARRSKRRQQAVENLEELIERQEPGLVKTVGVEAG